MSHQNDASRGEILLCPKLFQLKMPSIITFHLEGAISFETSQSVTD